MEANDSTPSEGQVSTESDDKERQTARFEEATVTASCNVDGVVEVLCESEWFKDLEVRVWEDFHGVQVSVEAQGGVDRFGMLLELEPEDVSRVIEMLEPFAE